MKARDIITSALEELNVLAPGETLNADTAALCLRRLNTIVDLIGADQLMLAQDVITTAAQAGDITLGEDDWADIAPGTTIIAASCDGVPLIRMQFSQYMTYASGDVFGAPCYFAPDGLNAVYLAPKPIGQTISLHTRKGVAAFEDLDTDYTAAAGWQNALGVMLAVRVAMPLLGSVPPHLKREERRAMQAVRSPRPGILNADTFQSADRFNILSGNSGLSGGDLIVDGGSP